MSWKGLDNPKPSAGDPKSMRSSLSVYANWGIISLLLGGPLLFVALTIFSQRFIPLRPFRVVRVLQLLAIAGIVAMFWMTRDAVAAVIKAFPQAAVMARVFDRLHMLELRDLKLAFAERELFEGAVTMGKAALRASGIDADEAERVEHEDRMRDCDRLELQRETGDVRAGWETSFAADRPLPGEEVPTPS